MRRPARAASGLAALVLASSLSAAAPARAAQPASAGAPALASAPSPDAGIPAAPSPPPPQDELRRGTPRGAMLGYLEATRAADFERAAEYLDLHSLAASEREARGPVLARELKIVLDQTLWVDLDALSDDPRGGSDDGLPSHRELVGRVAGPRGEVPIYLQRVPRADGAPIWKIASISVEQIPELYDRYGYTPLEERLPAWMLEPVLFESSLWSASALLALVLLALAGSWLVVKLVEVLMRPLAARTATDVDDRLVATTASPLRLAAAIGLFRIGTLSLTLPLPVLGLLRALEGALLIVALAWFGLRMIDLFTLVAVRRLQQRGVSSAVAAVPFGQKAAKAFALALAVIALLDGFGYDVTALLAGLGVGGIAVALAAQKTLENLFGGLTLFVDRPVAVGDFCRFGDRVGTVEAIGVRSTRLRTLDRTVVSVPNAEFASLQIESFAERDRVWYHPTLGLRYETTPAQLRHVMEEIRAMLRAHPRVSPDPARVRFVRFGAYSLDLEVFAYVETRDFGEYLELAEELNLRIMDIVADAGTGFAFPSQTLYVGADERPGTPAGGPRPAHPLQPPGGATTRGPE